MRLMKWRNIWHAQQEMWFRCLKTLWLKVNNNLHTLQQTATQNNVCDIGTEHDFGVHQSDVAKIETFRQIMLVFDWEIINKLVINEAIDFNKRQTFLLNPLYSW